MHDDPAYLTAVSNDFELYSGQLRALIDDLGMTGQSAELASARIDILAHTLDKTSTSLTMAADAANKARAAIVEAREAYRALPDATLSTLERAEIIGGGAVLG